MAVSSLQPSNGRWWAGRPGRTQRSFCFRLLLALGLLVCFAYCARPQQPTPPATRGILDLREHDWQTSGPVPLRGEWQFFWKSFIAPGFFPSTPEIPVDRSLTHLKDDFKPSILAVPGQWNQFYQGGAPIGGVGYGSYRLIVLLPAVATVPLGLRVVHSDSSHRLYVNGKLYDQAGVPAKDAGASRAGRSPTVVGPLPTINRLELVLHVSNYQHRNGGLPRALVIGPLVSLQRSRQRDVAEDMFLMGSLAIMCLYHLGLFALRRNERAPLYLAMFCALLALRTGLVGERSLHQIFWQTPFAYEHRAEYITFFLATPVFLAFARSVFTAVLQRWVLYASVLLALGFSLIVLFTPSLLYSEINAPYQIITIFVGSYILIAVSREAWRGNTGARTFLLGFLALFLAVINDILYNRLIIGTGFMVSWGLFVFIFSQAFLLSRRFTDAFHRSEQLAVDLANSEKKYRHLVEDSPDIILALDDSGTVVSVNRAVRQLLGIAPTRLEGRPLAEMLYTAQASSTLMGRHLFEERFSKLRESGTGQEFAAEFRAATGEPCELAVRLQRVNLEGGHAIFGTLTRKSEDLLARHTVAEDRHFVITSNFPLAETLNRALTAGLVAHLSPGDYSLVRLALREVLVNAIEHGNLGISFEEKTRATEAGNAIELLQERLRDPRLAARKLFVSINLTAERVIFVVRDEGNGFDHRAMIARARELEETPDPLFHGRGIGIALGFFDAVSYNETGNEVTLTKTFSPGPDLL